MKRLQNSIAKRIVATALELSIILACVFSLPMTASAIWGTTLVDLPRWLQVALDIVAKAAIVKIGEEMKQEAITWAKTSGFNGNPSFVTNPKDLLSPDLAEASGIFLSQLNKAGVCQPFGQNLNLDLSQYNINLDTIFQGGQGNGSDVDAVTRCTLDSLIPSGKLADYFTGTGFAAQGGYAPMMRALTSLPDNPDTIRDVVKAKLLERRQTAATEKTQEADRGSGYTSIKGPCDIKDDDGNCTHWLTITPAKNITDIVSKMVPQGSEDLSNGHGIVDAIIETAVSVIAQKTFSGGL